MAASTSPDLILHGGKFTTLDRANPNPEAVAITGGRFTAVGAAKRSCAGKGPPARRSSTSTAGASFRA